MKMPPGYRFVPTDNELIEHHLMNKINNEPNLSDEIKEVEFYNNDPQTLADTYAKLGDEEWYFFSSRHRKYANGHRPSRTARGGYWKATGATKNVYGQGGGLVGKKRTLDYYDGDRKKNVKTNWGMHEFWIDHPPRPRTHADDMKLDDWVLCRIYKKASKVKGVCKQQNISNGLIVIEGEQEIESTSGGGSSGKEGEEVAAGSSGREREEASTSSLSIVDVARERDDEQVSHDFNPMTMQDCDDDFMRSLLQFSIDFEPSINIDDIL